MLQWSVNAFPVMLFLKFPSSLRVFCPVRAGGWDSRHCLSPSRGLGRNFSKQEFTITVGMIQGWIGKSQYAFLLYPLQNLLKPFENAGGAWKVCIGSININILKIPIYRTGTQEDQDLLWCSLSACSWVLLHRAVWDFYFIFFLAPLVSFPFLMRCTRETCANFLHYLLHTCFQHTVCFIS